MADATTRGGLTQALADMIIDLPTEADFRAIGFQLLNMAWDTAATLLCDIDEADYYEIDPDEFADDLEVKDAYWQAARTQLSTALAVAQQGSEFLIKARIAAVSPYLLIFSSPKDWPSCCATKPTPFADFRTIDAQDLIRTNNTFSKTPISDEFIIEFEKLRRTRNSIIHSVNKHINVHITELLRAVLLINEHLGQSLQWTILRRKYLESTPKSKIYPGSYADYRLVLEFSVVKEILSSSDLKRFFGFNEKHRTYICPHCNYDLTRDAENEAKTASLKPNNPTSTNIWCFVCRKDQEVERSACTQAECKGNVISSDWGQCLTCSADVS